MLKISGKRNPDVRLQAPPCRCLELVIAIWVVTIWQIVKCYLKFSYLQPLFSSEHLVAGKTTDYVNKMIEKHMK